MNKCLDRVRGQAATNETELPQLEETGLAYGRNVKVFICIIIPRKYLISFYHYLLLPAYNARLTYYTLSSDLCKGGFSMQVSI